MLVSIFMPIESHFSIHSRLWQFLFGKNLCSQVSDIANCMVWYDTPKGSNTWKCILASAYLLSLAVVLGQMDDSTWYFLFHFFSPVLYFCFLIWSLPPQIHFDEGQTNDLVSPSACDCSKSLNNHVLLPDRVLKLGSILFGYNTCCWVARPHAWNLCL